MTQSTCTVCGAVDLKELLRIDDIPVFCNVQWPDYHTAIAAARGDIHLAFCRGCGHVFNTAFDPERIQYSQAYENSLHFSPQFHAHAEALAARLVEKYALRNKTIVEIGCGKGEFISLLCAEDRNKGYGFDLSYQRDTSRTVSSESVTFIKDFYSERYAQLRPDFVCCRHVLEHIQDPIPFLQTVGAAAGSKPELVFYFEVPNVLFSLRDMGIWDFIYEHCSYFSNSSLFAAFRNAGFDVLDVYADFGNQFLGLEARVSPTANRGERNQRFPESESQAILWEVVETFKRRYTEKIAYWYAWMNDAAEQGNRAAIWGAGSKGVTFVNTIKVQGVVATLVDVNPHKQGRFVGGTGHTVIGPQSFARDPADYVVVMNSLYRDEIAACLRDLDIESPLVCA